MKSLKGEMKRRSCYRGHNRLLIVVAACTLACACALAGTSVVAPADSAKQRTAGLAADVAPLHQCRAGHKPPSGPQQVLRTVPGATNEVALTFDMGGRLEPALSILQFLADQQVCATIFLTGAISQTPAGQEVLAFIRARPHLFEVGNHTMHHCNFRDGGGGSPTTAPCPTTRPSSTFVQRELTEAAAVIRQGTGQDPVPYWRPPYGAYDQSVADAAAAVGYSSTLLWSIDTIDWKPVSEGGPTAQQIADKVLAGAAPGSIVLFHLGGWNTREALPLIVSRLRERGFRLTAVSDIPGR
jgi:peptidoglycan-N-acetylglucosamine deacetylase